MKYRSLADLEHLIPESERKAPPTEAPKTGSKTLGKGKSVRVTLETAGRKGKSVTLVSGLQHDPATIEEIARTLKQHCGAGGTVKDGTIEIQGDQRDAVSKKLRSLDFRVP